jgi:hypothetical protein
MRLSLHGREGWLHVACPGLLGTGRPLQCLGSDEVHTSVLRLWCGRRPVVDHFAAWPHAFDSTRPLSSPLSLPLSSAFR